MILRLRVSIGFGDTVESAAQRILKLDETIIFDEVEVDAVGIGAALYGRLAAENMRAPLTLACNAVAGKLPSRTNDGSEDVS